MRRGRLSRRRLLGALVVALWVAPAAAERAPDVLLVTVDTLRPDALGWIGHEGATPSLDRLAAEGFAFPAAVSPVPLTLPAHTSILTGLVPRSHGVRDNGQTVPPEAATLAEALAGAGYRTLAVVGGFPLQQAFGLDQGFDVYDDHLTRGSEGWLERPAGEVTEAALSVLPDDAQAPWFLWVHYYDPHEPYDPPRAFWRPGRRGGYLGEVEYVDHAVGRLLDGLAERAERPRLTVFAADHGEALGEHAEATHGYFVYDSTLEVPLVFHWPGRIASEESRRPARLIDIPATVADLVGMAWPAGPGGGRSLRPVLEGRGGGEAEPAYLETRLPWIYFGWAPLKAWRTERWKLIVAPRPELYDLEADPRETRNLYGEKRAVAGELARDLRAFEAECTEAGSRSVDDPELLARLRDLGYVGAGTVAREAPAGAPDPKDRIELRNLLREAEALARGGRPTEALAIFERVREVEPDNRAALLRSGVMLLKLGRLEEASDRLRQAVRQDPARAEARWALADSLTRSGHPREALPHWLEVVRLQPARPEAWVNLAAVWRRLGESAKALEAAREAAKLSPEDEAITALIGQLEGESGSP